MGIPINRDARMMKVENVKTRKRKACKIENGNFQSQVCVCTAYTNLANQNIFW